MSAHQSAALKRSVAHPESPVARVSKTKGEVTFEVAFYHCKAGEVWIEAGADGDEGANSTCETCMDMVDEGMEASEHAF